MVVLLSLLRWFTTRYQITPEQVQLRTGLFRRRSMTTPADRVRTVDVTAHALHRVLGLARVSIGTGISDRKREGLVLDGLTAEAAGRLRAELLHRARLSGAPRDGRRRACFGFACDASTARTGSDVRAGLGWEPAEEPIAVLDPSWIRYAPFTLSGAATALAVLGFGWRLFDQTRMSGKATVIHSVTRQFDHRPIWLDVLQGVLGAVLTVVVLSMIGYLLAFWNFRLTRHAGGSLHVSRGLITTRATSIEERRLHGVELSELLPLRLVGGARLLAIATGLRVGRGAERGGDPADAGLPRSAGPPGGRRGAHRRHQHDRVSAAITRQTGVAPAAGPGGAADRPGAVVLAGVVVGRWRCRAGRCWCRCCCRSWRCRWRWIGTATWGTATPGATCMSGAVRCCAGGWCCGPRASSAGTCDSPSSSAGPGWSR